MADIENISSDTVIGIANMSTFTGINARSLYHLCSTGQLPGSFRMGKNWALLKSVYVAEIRARASRATVSA